MPAQLKEAEPDLHTVVFDVNILLDVAELLGPPFSWDKFRDTAARHSMKPVPNRADNRIDSLRAVALTTTGRLAGPEPLEVWTSDHIDKLLVHKATQPRGGATAETRGLGWSAADADGLLHDFLYDLVYDMTGGARIEIQAVDGHPPLDHEDACVFTTALAAADDAAPPSIKYCVTRDRAFRTAASLNPNVLVLYPHEFITLVRRSRNALVVKRMRPPFPQP
ncbi:hypothetical protein BJ973_004460 [Actinoplanes tereljensis]|uniref:Uncharacterized protein n=1 Tax=Paractinoplanes tereljensis TaxID=571912 RepID=A0A919NTV1_9ACTN|nr:hypothetical protein [Actinoplanes tereljensis]GIF23849.1 hypothetical protein Ate02nite_65790 [Actinoplanes tereljensis]